MKFRTLPIVAVLFIAAAMVVQFAISFSNEKEHVREVVEYKMQVAQKDFFYVLMGFHNSADAMRKYVLVHPNDECELLEATRVHDARPRLRHRLHARGVPPELDILF